MEFVVLTAPLTLLAVAVYEQTPNFDSTFRPRGPIQLKRRIEMGSRSVRCAWLLKAFSQRQLSVLAILVAIGTLLAAVPSPSAQNLAPEKILHSFAGSPSDGAGPYLGHLIADSSGNLYGTTRSGGAHDAGTVFELVKSGTTYTERVLHSFGSSPNPRVGDGANPYAGLIMDSGGNLYGTTFGGGTDDDGTVFELKAPLSANMSDIVLHRFGIAGDREDFEAGPCAGLIMDASGNLYGTTEGGSGGSDGFSEGTVFELAAPLSAGMNDIALHRFDSAWEGVSPCAGLIMDSSGNLYGTTAIPGGPNGYGTVFELKAPLSAHMPDIALHIFRSGDDGANPYAGLIMDAGGTLYGTTYRGGTNDYYGGDTNDHGTVFELKAPPSADMNRNVLHAFRSGSDGANPYAELIMDSSGNLYGTTARGGANGAGTLFELTAPLSDNMNAIVLHAFGSGSDGANPFAGLTIDGSGNLYGTTQHGGTNGHGTVFELSAPHTAGVR
jgi:uncharacterized repeat protein (TIGR03803 family)